MRTLKLKAVVISTEGRDNDYKAKKPEKDTANLR
jgi:hypothetical protein